MPELKLPARAAAWTLEGGYGVLQGDRGRFEILAGVCYLHVIALPIFGKLADLYRTKPLYIVSILIFLAASIAAGFARSMVFLIVCRAIQGIGAGGNFALVYIVLADVSPPPSERGKSLSLASFVWGLSSVLGPTIGGFIVAYFSWPWIFFINEPLGLLSLAGVSLYLVDTRDKKKGASIDYPGALTLSLTILSFLFIFLLGGQSVGGNY